MTLPCTTFPPLLRIRAFSSRSTARCASGEQGIQARTLAWMWKEGKGGGDRGQQADIQMDEDVYFERDRGVEGQRGGNEKNYLHT